VINCSLSDKLQYLSFSPSKTDISLFHYKKGPVKIYFPVYVDDIIIVSSSAPVVSALLSALQASLH
jgi:hypothetical protein